MNKKLLSTVFTMVLLVVTVFTLLPKSNDKVLTHITGQTMGSITYNIKVVADQKVEFKESIDSILSAFNQSLSTYIPNSEISIFNKRGQLSNPSKLFINVLVKSQEVHERTDSAFDPTVGPLVNAWGFGPEKIVTVPDSTLIDSLLQLVNLEKVVFINGSVSKEANVHLDFSAIAKGQAVDEVGKWLEQKGISSYMIEIGGEVRCRGANESNEIWSIGIEDPTVSSFDQQIVAVAKLNNLSLATSGNYRNYFMKDSILYAHIVDPRTGYTAKHNLLSASVFAKDCMSADAYATAFMVLGLEESIRIVEGNPELHALFIFTSANQLDVYVSTGISDSIKLTGLLASIDQD